MTAYKFNFLDYYCLQDNDNEKKANHKDDSIKI